MIMNVSTDVVQTFLVPRVECLRLDLSRRFFFWFLKEERVQRVARFVVIFSVHRGHPSFDCAQLSFFHHVEIIRTGRWHWFEEISQSVQTTAHLVSGPSGLAFLH